MTSKPAILIAEDEPAMRMALVEVLSILEDFEILQASDGRQAMEAIERDRPRLVILDLLMPETLDGFEVLKALRSRREAGLPGSPDPKVVVLSALNESHLLETLRQLGADRVLMKPLRIDEIMDLVRDEMASSRRSPATPEPVTNSHRGGR